MSKIHDYEWDEKPLADIETDLVFYFDDLFDAVADGKNVDEFVTESGDHFCGCETCYTRETLAFLIPRIIDAWELKQIRLQDANKEVDGDLQLVQDGWVVESESE